MKKLLVLQHENSTPPALVADWANSRNIPFDVLFASEIKNWNALLNYNSLIILGGSMDTWETEKHPWLLGEKEFIKNFISKEKNIYGICLGCQLLSEALGGRVLENPEWEIGWLPVNTISGPIYFAQYHKYKVTLPAGSENLGTSQWCDVQGFKMGKNIIATQFHPEANLGWYSGKLPEGVTANDVNIQSLDKILSEQEKHFSKARDHFYNELDELFIDNPTEVQR